MIILHQIWFQGYKFIPNEYKKYQKEWQDEYSNKQDTDYILWDKISIEKLINTSNNKIKKYYYSLPYMIQKIDFAKYIILYNYGGLYVDLDTIFIKHLKFLYQDIKQSVIICDMYCAYNFIIRITLNNFFFYVRNIYNTFIKLIIDECIKYKRKFYDIKSLYILRSTGPNLITRVYDIYNNPEDILVITKKHLSKYFKHESHGSWWGNKGSINLLKVLDKHDVINILILISIIVLIYFLS